VQREHAAKSLAAVQEARHRECVGIYFQCPEGDCCCAWQGSSTHVLPLYDRPKGNPVAAPEVALMHQRFLVHFIKNEIGISVWKFLSMALMMLDAGC
jgi:hypothetical protein